MAMNCGGGKMIIHWGDGKMAAISAGEGKGIQGFTGGEMHLTGEKCMLQRKILHSFFPVI